MLRIISFISSKLASANSLLFLKRKNKLCTILVVLSSRVRADNMVPINILNGSLPSSDRSNSRAVILGGLEANKVASIFSRIFLIGTTIDRFHLQGYKFDK
jgi:hypothetical protein